MHRTALFLSTALLLAGCVSQPGTQTSTFGLKRVELPTSVEPYYSDGKRQLAAGNYGLAIDRLRRAVRADPQAIDALNALAIAYDKVRRPDLARRYFETALGLAPDSDVLLNNLGYSLLVQGETGAARPLLARAAASPDPAVRGKGERNLSLARRAVPTNDAALRMPQPTRVVRLAFDEHTLLARDEALSPGEGAPPADQAGTKPDERRGLVVVVNATGRHRLAARYDGYLRARGFEVAGRANARSWRAKSEIRFTAAQRPAALVLAASLPFRPALTRITGTYAGIRLELGHDALGFDSRLRRNPPQQPKELHHA